MVGSWSNARAKSVNGPTVQGPLSHPILLRHGLNLRALNGESCTVIGLCSFKIGSASTVRHAFSTLSGMGLQGVSAKKRLSIVCPFQSRTYE